MNLLGFLQKQSCSDTFGSAARRNECLANALCRVSLGNSAGVKINKVSGSRGGSGVEVDVGSLSLPPDQAFVLEPPAEVRSSLSLELHKRHKF